MNIKNRTLFIADNLDVMRGINSQCIDLIYLDPPFNSKKKYKAPIGSPAEEAGFKDIWTNEDIKYKWHGQIAEEHEELYQIIQASGTVYDKSMKIYLMAMTVRLFEMKRLLKPAGSIYLHCDPTASHYIKLVMDGIFGKKNFRNEIAWAKYSGRKNNARKKFNTQQDTIFYYAYPSPTFFPQHEPLSESAIKEYRHKDKNGRLYRFARQGKGYESAGGHRRIYLDENPGNAVGSLWISKDLQLAQSSKERTGWPTQKPLALLHRILKALSKEGNMVLDPFCGCATACVAAEQLGRQWVGIDISPSAETITKLRLEEIVGEESSLFNPLTDVIIQTKSPIKTDLTEAVTQTHLPKAHTYKHEIYGQQEGKCIGCNYYFPFRNMTIDLVIPKSKGGTDHKENLQLLCNACNSTKGARSQSEFITTLKERGIRVDAALIPESRVQTK